MSKKKSNLNENVEQPADGSDVMRTMQLEDLDLGNHGAQKGSDLIDDVEGLIQEDTALDAEANNPMEHVDAISRRIEELTLSLQQPIDSCDCHETANRMIAIDARLAKLQNEVNKQSGRGDKLESGLELIGVFGNKIESLTDVVKLSVMEDEVKEDYTGHFQELASQLTELKQSLGDIPDSSEGIAKQTESIQALDSRVAEVIEQARSTPEKIQELSGKLDSMGELIENPAALKSLDEKIDSLQKSLSQNEKLDSIETQLTNVNTAVQKTELLDALSEKVDSIASLVQNNEKLAGMDSKLDKLSKAMQNQKQLESLNQKVDAVAAAVNDPAALTSLNQEIAGLKDSLSGNEQIAELTTKFEKLHDFVKLGALENEQFDATRFNAMGDQITAIGQMLVEKPGKEGDNLSGEQLDALNSKVDSLAELVKENSGSTDNDAVALLLQKFQGLQDFVSTSLVAGGSGDGASAEFLQELSSKVEALTETMASAGSVSSDGASAEHIQQLSEKLDSLSAQVEAKEASSGDGGSSEEIQSLSAKVDSLAALVEAKAAPAGDGGASAERIEELSSKLDSLSTLVESHNASPVSFDGDLPDYSNDIQELTSKLEETQASVTTLVSSLVPVLESLQNAAAAPIAAEDGEEGSSNWEQQKKALLEGYGMPSDDEGGEAAAGGAAAAGANNEEIEALRSELEEKLRRAEIDISIERAKIHQERRDLEEMQNDLDRQQQKINTHGSSSSSDSEEGGEDGESGGRWSRFLGN